MMKTVRIVLLSTVCWLFGMLKAMGDATDLPSDMAAPQVKQKRVLPLMADEATKRGIELPLPFGSGLVITGLMDRRIDVTDVRIGLNGASQSVSDVVDLGSSSRVFNVNAKFDAWLLPFLNVYALLGYVYNETDTHIVATLPRPGPLPGVTQRENTVQTTLDGPVGGAGFTIAGGYRNFFVVADASYVRTNLGFDDRFTATIAGVRAGWNGKLHDLPTQIWLGVGNWDTAATAKGHVDIEDIGRLDFEADQRPHTPWIYDVGSNLQLTKRLHLFADLGFDFDGAYALVIGPTYRF